VTFLDSLNINVDDAVIINNIMEIRVRYHLLLVIIQYFLPQINAEESLKWYSRDGNLIAPDSLDDSKKENRQMAVIVGWAGERKQITLSCIMDGFEGNETSTTDWTSDFNDTQITKSDLVIRNSLSSKMAFWNATIDIDWKDSGSKRVSCNYQQGYFAKKIEVEFNIYVLALSPEDKKESSSLEKCPEKVDISLNEGNVDDPGPKIQEDVKKQIKQIFPSAANIVEKENVFNASITLEDLKEINSNFYVDVCPEPIPESATSTGGFGSTGGFFLALFVILIIVVLTFGFISGFYWKYRPHQYTELRSQYTVLQLVLPEKRSYSDS